MNILLAPIEAALNICLRDDPVSSKRAAKMAGKCFSIEIQPLSMTINCHFLPDSIQLTMNDNCTPDAKIHGTPLQLFNALINKDQRHQFFKDGLHIEGDAEFAQQVTDLFDHLNFDWEEHLARIIGDVPAYQLSQFTGKVSGWLQSARSNFRQDMSDYLHEETGWFPVKEELKDFFNDIDTLRMDTDRLESRIAHLTSQLNKEEMP